MAKIYIGLSKPKKWKAFAQLIMLGYGIPYSHVYIKFRSTKYDRDMIYQASHSMVNFIGSTMFFEENIAIEEFEVELSDEKFNEMICFAIDNAGKPYGVKQALGMAIVRIAEVFGKYIENPFRDGGNTYVCSELGAYVLENFAGGVIPKDIDDITPKDLYDYLTKIKASLNDKTV